MGYDERRRRQKHRKHGAELAGMARRSVLRWPTESDLTREDIARLGQIIGKLLQFEPSARASARQVLDDPWFNE